MRVAFVSAHYAPMIGGVEKHVVAIATRLAAQGHQVEVLTHAEPGSGLAPVELIDGVTVRRFPVPLPSRNYAFSPALSLHLHRHGGDYDVLHAHGYHALPALQATLARPPALVFTPHYHGTGHSFFRKLLHPPYRRLGRLIFTRAGRVIAVAPPEGELILSHFPEVRRRLSVVPNGVDRPALDGAEPFDLQSRVVLSAGRLRSTSRSIRRSPRWPRCRPSSSCASPVTAPFAWSSSSWSSGSVCSSGSASSARSQRRTSIAGFAARPCT